MTPRDKDIYDGLRDRISRASIDEIEVLLAEALETNSVFQHTGQSDPSSNTQLKTVYAIMEAKPRARFRVALKNILVDELSHTRSLVLLERIVDLAAIIGMGEVCVPLTDFLRRHCRPNSENIKFLNSVFPVLVGLSKQKRPCEDVSEFFRHTLVTDEWSAFHDLSLVAICYLDRGFIAEHLNRHLVRVVESNPHLRSTIRTNFLRWNLMPSVWPIVGQVREDVCQLLLNLFCDGQAGGFQLFQATEDNVSDMGVPNAGLWASQAQIIDSDHPIQLDKTYEMGVGPTNPNFELIRVHRISALENRALVN